MNSISSCKTLTSKQPNKKHTMSFLSIKATISMRQLQVTRTERVLACLASRLQIAVPKQIQCKTLKEWLLMETKMLSMMVKNNTRIVVMKPIKRQLHLMKSWVKSITKMTMVKSNKMKNKTPITTKCSSTKCAKKSNWTRLKKTKTR